MHTRKFKYTSPQHAVITARAGRICHKYPFYDLGGVTRVTDDFGTSVQVDKGAILFYVRGPVASYQDEHYDH